MGVMGISGMGSHLFAPIRDSSKVKSLEFNLVSIAWRLARWSAWRALAVC